MNMYYNNINELILFYQKYSAVAAYKQDQSKGERNLKQIQKKKLL